MRSNIALLIALWASPFAFIFGLVVGSLRTGNLGPGYFGVGVMFIFVVAMSRQAKHVKEAVSAPRVSTAVLLILNLLFVVGAVVAIATIWQQ